MDKREELRRKVKNINIEGAKIGIRNFSGKPGQYNAEGNKSFCVFIDKETALELEREGWNVKWPKPRPDADENEIEEVGYIQVSVAYTNYPPKIIMITGSGKTRLDEKTVSILDWAEIETVDLIIRPYVYDVQGKVGIKAYVQSMYVRIVEDEFESKYYDIPESANKCLTLAANDHQTPNSDD